MQVRTPKMLKFERIIEAIGPARAEELMLLYVGPQLVGTPHYKASAKNLQKGHEMATTMWKPTLEARSWATAYPAIRKFFAENPRHNSAFARWCRDQLSDLNLSESTENIIYEVPPEAPVKIKRKYQRRGAQAAR